MGRLEVEGHNHLLAEEILDYLAGRASEAVAMKVEESVAVCDDCAVEAMRLRALAAAAERWTAAEHGRAYWRAQLTGALETAERAPEYSRWQERLKRWRETAGGRAAAALRIMMRAPGVASDLITEGLDALTGPKGGWRFQLEMQPARVLGPAEEATAPPVVAVSVDAPQAQVAVSTETREVVVRVDTEVGVRPGLIMLFSVEQGAAAPQVAEPRKQRGQHAYLARFTDVKPGEYLVVFEPR